MLHIKAIFSSAVNIMIGWRYKYLSDWSIMGVVYLRALEIMAPLLLHLWIARQHDTRHYWLARPCEHRGTQRDAVAFYCLVKSDNERLIMGAVALNHRRSLYTVWKATCRSLANWNGPAFRHSFILHYRKYHVTA